MLAAFFGAAVGATTAAEVAEDTTDLDDAAGGDATTRPTRPADHAEPAIEEFVVTGSALPLMDVLAGASTTRIETDARLIEGQQISDLLAEVPGVQVRRFGGVGERFEISIRGSRPEQVPVFLDGVRLDTSLTGASDLSILCLDVLQEIQVVRGAGASRTGSGAIGGVVNLVSRRAGRDPETRVRVSGGNFGTAEGSVRHARRIGPWNASLAYCGLHTEGDFRFQRARRLVDGVPVGSAKILERINNQADRHTALTHLGRSLGPGELRVTQLLSHLERGVPGSEFDQRVRSREQILSTLSSVGYDMPLAAVRGSSLDFVVSHRFEQSDYEDPDPFVGGDPIDTKTGVHTVTARGGGRVERDLVGGHHAFSLFGEGRFDERSTNLANQKSRLGGTLRAEIESTWWGDRLRVSPSIRMERYQGVDLQWIPSLLVRVRPFEFVELRAAAARSYRVPSFQELYLPDRGFERGNENLRPEDALSGEIGTTLRSPFESAWLDLSVEATWFWSRVDDSIAFQQISTSVVAPVNTGRADTHGYELTLRYAPHPWLHLVASRTVTHAEIRATGNPVPGIARALTDGRLELGPPDLLKLVGEIHYTGRIAVSGGGAASLPSRITYDASASLDLARIPKLPIDRIAKSLWLSLRGRNLGNEAVRDGRYFPRPGRNFAVALEGVF
jgi:outer membrane receptor protein involved in Fe transport